MKTKGERQGQDVRVFSMGESQCVWMKAGVVDFKICDHAFDCTSCGFDKEISGQPLQKPAAVVSWREAMRNPKLHKQCRHMLTDRVLFKLCSHNYQCQDCAYDQMLYEYDQLPAEEGLPAHVAAQVSPAAPLQAYSN